MRRRDNNTSQTRPCGFRGGIIDKNRKTVTTKRLPFQMKKNTAFSVGVWLSCCFLVSNFRLVASQLDEAITSGEGLEQHGSMEPQNIEEDPSLHHDANAAAAASGSSHTADTTTTINPPAEPPLPRKPVSFVSAPDPTLPLSTHLKPLAVIQHALDNFMEPADDDADANLEDVLTQALTSSSSSVASDDPTADQEEKQSYNHVAPTEDYAGDAEPLEATQHRAHPVIGDEHENRHAHQLDPEATVPSLSSGTANIVTNARESFVSDKDRGQATVEAVQEATIHATHVTADSAAAREETMQQPTGTMDGTPHAAIEKEEDVYTQSAGAFSEDARTATVDEPPARPNTHYNMHHARANDEAVSRQQELLQELHHHAYDDDDDDDDDGNNRAHESEKNPGSETQNVVSEQQVLLQELHYRANAPSFDEEQEEEDERTLLDVFGEVAKEYLTQKVIPETDASCRWDWRSIRCEPACDCQWKARTGDYHLGRACRLRPDEERDETCQPIDPASVYGDKPVPKRVLSLMHTTVHLVQQKTGRGLQNVWQRARSRVARLQERVCVDVWALQQECWPHSRLPTMTVPERVLCGPLVLWTCEPGADETTAAASEQLPPVDNNSASWARGPRQT